MSRRRLLLARALAAADRRLHRALDWCGGPTVPPEPNALAAGPPPVDPDRLLAAFEAEAARIRRGGPHRPAETWLPR